MSHDDKTSEDFLRDLGNRPQDTWTGTDISRLFLIAIGCNNLRPAPSAERRTLPLCLECEEPRVCHDGDYCFRETKPLSAPASSARSQEGYRTISTGYQDVFNAIAAAVKIEAGNAIGISVEKFLANIPTVPVTPNSATQMQFEAVGWWDSHKERALWEPGKEPVHGALLFRPISRAEGRDA